MAGTGHKYEIVNIHVVRSFLDEFAAQVPDKDAAAWFSCPHLLKHVTSPLFVERLQPGNAETIIDRHTEGEERKALMRRAGEGADLRVFVPEFYTRLGHDLGHIADWLRALPNANKPFLHKLPRVTVEAATLLADKWSVATARILARNPQPGLTQVFLWLPSGRIWVDLLDEQALAAESSMLDHCVHSYGAQLRSGARILSLRDPDGKAHVTVDAYPFHGSYRVNQIRALGNGIPHKGYRRDIVALMNALNATDIKGEAGRCGLLRKSDGQWCRAEEIAQRISLFGMSGLAYGSQVQVIDPADPEAVLATLIGPTAEWWKGDIANVGLRLYGDGDNRISRRTCRAVCDLANRLGIGEEKLWNVWNATYQDGRWAPLADFCEEWDLDGLDILVNGQEVLLASSPGANEICMRIQSLPKQEGDKLSATPLLHVDRVWRPAEVRRVAKLLDLFRVYKLDLPKGYAKLPGLMENACQRWIYFPDAADKQESQQKTRLGEPKYWWVSDWFAKLQRDPLASDSDADAIFHWDRGTGEVAYTVMNEKFEVAQEVAALLNRLGAVPSAVLMNGLKWKETWQTKPRPQVVYLGGAWQAVQDKSDLIRLLAAQKSGQFKDCHASEVALALLSEEDAPGLDKILARHLAAWCRRSKAGDFKRNWLINRGWITKRLIQAIKARSHMTKAESASVSRFATAILRSLIGRTRRKKFMSTNGDLALEIFEHIWRDVDEKLRARMVGWALQYESLPLFDPAPEMWTKVADHVKTFWIDLAESFPAESWVRRTVADAAISTLVRLILADKTEIRSPEAAMTWVRCFQANSLDSHYKGYQRWRQLEAHHVERFDSIIRTKAAAEPERWQELVAVLPELWHCIPTQMQQAA